MQSVVKPTGIYQLYMPFLLSLVSLSLQLHFCLKHEHCSSIEVTYGLSRSGANS
ncbi:hypothetical protein LDENG_00239860 [Lucifuga dentata]|nr:hypothetical protein LDENG_00239860 [Lucifuga dentata]